MYVLVNKHLSRTFSKQKRNFHHHQKLRKPPKTKKPNFFSPRSLLFSPRSLNIWSSLLLRQSRPEDALASSLRES